MSIDQNSFNIDINITFLVTGSICVTRIKYEKSISFNHWIGFQEFKALNLNDLRSTILPINQLCKVDVPSFLKIGDVVRSRTLIVNIHTLNLFSML